MCIYRILTFWITALPSPQELSSAGYYEHTQISDEEDAKRDD